MLRERERERERQRQRDRDRDRETETERETERDRDRERERVGRGEGGNSEQNVARTFSMRKKWVRPSPANNSNRGGIDQRTHTHMGTAIN